MNYFFIDFAGNEVFSDCSSQRDGCYESENRAILNTGHQIQSILYNQDENFLKAIPRTCNSPPNLKSNYIGEAWNVHQPDFKEWADNQVTQF